MSTRSFVRSVYTSQHTSEVCSLSHRFPARRCVCQKAPCSIIIPEMWRNLDPQEYYTSHSHYSCVMLVWERQCVCVWMWGYVCVCEQEIRLCLSSESVTSCVQKSPCRCTWKWQDTVTTQCFKQDSAHNILISSSFHSDCFLSMLRQQRTKKKITFVHVIILSFVMTTLLNSSFSWCEC